MPPRTDWSYLDRKEDRSEETRPDLELKVNEDLWCSTIKVTAEGPASVTKIGVLGHYEKKTTFASDDRKTCT